MNTDDLQEAVRLCVSEMSDLASELASNGNTEAANSAQERADFMLQQFGDLIK